MTAEDNMLGEYLRAQRGRVRPGQVGLPDGGSRRVPGLRRAEVATLAGISVDYYLRLEQGRDHRPSRQVLDALAEALRMDATATAYLLSLAGQPTTRNRKRPRREVVPETVAMLLGSINLPAFVEGRYLDVLAANAFAAAVSPRLTIGRNRLRDVFTDPDEQALYSDWDDTTARLVAGFRRSVGTDVNDARFIELVGELSLVSDHFRSLWAQQDVRPPQNWPVTIDHPLVGRLTVNREKLIIGDTAQSLVLTVYHPTPGSDSPDRLTLLASYSASNAVSA